MNCLMHVERYDTLSQLVSTLYADPEDADSERRTASSEAGILTSYHTSHLRAPGPLPVLNDASMCATCGDPGLMLPAAT